MGWIANSSYDDVVTLAEIVFDEAFSQTCDPTERLSL